MGKLSCYILNIFFLITPIYPQFGSVKINFDDDTVVGELLECPDCGTELEVTALDPPALAEAPEAEEDWGE